MYTYPISIEHAAKILDRDKPDWYTKITKSLVMGSPHDCLLGQVYGNYYESFKKLFGDMPSYEHASDSIFGNRTFPSNWQIEINKRKLENDIMNRRSIVWAAAQINIGHTVCRKCKPDVTWTKASRMSFTLEDLEAVDWQIYIKPMVLSDLKKKDRFKFKGDNKIAIKLGGANQFLYEDDFVVLERVQNFEVEKV